MSCMLYLTFYTSYLFKEKDDPSREKSKFIKGFCEGDDQGTTVTELAELGRPLGEKILKFWMDKLNRNLTNSQVQCIILYYAIL